MSKEENLTKHFKCCCSPQTLVVVSVSWMSNTFNLCCLYQTKTIITKANQRPELRLLTNEKPVIACVRHKRSPLQWLWTSGTSRLWMSGTMTAPIEWIWMYTTFLSHLSRQMYEWVCFKNALMSKFILSMLYVNFLLII